MNQSDSYLPDHPVADEICPGSLFAQFPQMNVVVFLESFCLVLVSVAGHCRTCSFNLIRAESPPKPHDLSGCLPLPLCAVLVSVPQIASIRAHLYWQVQADTRVCFAGSLVSKQDPILGCSGLLVTLEWWKPLKHCHSWEAGRACLLAPRDSLVQLQELCTQLQAWKSGGAGKWLCRDTWKRGFSLSFRGFLCVELNFLIASLKIDLVIR